MQAPNVSAHDIIRPSDWEDLLIALPKKYNDIDRTLILRAFRMGEQAHKEQKRASGEPYFTHCIAVAKILAEFRVPSYVIAAGLLHDTVEDTLVTLEDLRREFGDKVAELVDGVTKLTELPRVSRGDQQLSEEEKEAKLREIARRRGLPDPEKVAEELARRRKSRLDNETLRKTFLAMGRDPSVTLIKLADRLHNMRTLTFMPEHKRRRIAQQTMDIFAPLANRMGIWQLKWELEDLSFRYLSPDTYREIANKLAAQRSRREREMAQIEKRLKGVIHGAGIEADISARPKHIYSIYKKMKRKNVPFEQVHDVRGVRVILQTVRDCYAVLGLIHTQENWRPIPREFDDYIANPKDNFYQSLHTAVYYEDGKQIEIQIRTLKMHQHAEFGLAAHWIYKEGTAQDDEFRKDIEWLRRMVTMSDSDDENEPSSNEKDAEDYLDALKVDFLEERVYVFTPRGDIIDLPAGSTPIDFAYHIHTEIGHRCRGAKVSGQLVPLSTKLKTGDQVEIMPTKKGGPSRDWLNPGLGMVHTNRARSKIQHWFRRQAREKNANTGRSMLEKELRRLGMSARKHEDLAGRFQYRTTEDLYVAVATGDMQLGKIFRNLSFDDDQPLTLDQEEEEIIKKHTASVKPLGDSISVKGMKGVYSTMARCCRPAPGDEICGYITRGRGITVHRKDCPNILRVREPERLVETMWGEDENTYAVSVRISAFDRDGLMRDVSAIIADENVGISHAVIYTKKSEAVFELVLNVRDVAQLSRIFNKIEQLPNVKGTQRVKG